MAELNKLTDRILEEARLQADEIKKEAKEKVDRLNLNSKKQAEQKYSVIVEKGALEAENLKERLRSNANLRARDNELKVKQETIQKVFESALEDMKNIKDEELISYIEKNAGFSEESLIIVPKGKVDIVRRRFPNAKISDERFADSGFIEIAGGIEKNFTFDTQVEYIKDDIQGEIAKVLFK